MVDNEISWVGLFFESALTLLMQWWMDCSFQDGNFPTNEWYFNHMHHTVIKNKFYEIYADILVQTPLQSKTVGWIELGLWYFYSFGYKLSASLRLSCLVED